MTTVAVVIPSPGRAELFEICLPSIMEGIDTPDELFVVFQGGRNPELEATVRTRFPAATVIWASNRGASAARNTGAAHARSDVIAFIDDDCRADPHWLRRHRHLFFSRPDVGIAGGQVIAEQSQESNGVILAVQNSPHGYEIQHAQIRWED